MANEVRQLKVVIAGDERSARKALKVLGTGLQEADEKAARAGESVGAIGRLAQAGAVVARAAFAGVAAAAAALATQVNEVIDFGDAKARFEAQIGDPQYAAELGRIAGRLYTKNFGESMAENMQAVRLVMSSGLLEEDAVDADIERVTGKVLRLAKVFDLEVGAAARSAGQLIRTGLVKDADHAMDLLVRGFQQTGDLAGDLLDTVDEYSTQFRNLGLSGEQAFGLLAQGAKAGARDLDVVADTLKEFSIEAVAGGARVMKGFESLGLNARKMSQEIAKGGPGAARALDVVFDRLRAIEDPVRRNAVAIELFGTKAEDMGQALYALDVSSAAQMMGEVAGAADRMGEALERSPNHQLQVFYRRVKQAVVEGLAAAIPYVVEFGRWVQRNQEWLKPLGVTLAGVAGSLMLVTGAVRAVTAAKAAWAAITTVASGVAKAWAVATRVATAAQWLWNAALSANPIGLVVVALAALVAGLIVAYKQSETFRNVVHGAFDAVRTAAVWLWEGGIKPLWQGVQVAFRAIMAIVTPVAKFIADLFGAHIQIVKSVGAIFWWLAQQVVAVVVAHIKGHLTALANTAKWLYEGAVRPAFDRIGAVATWLWQSAIVPMANKISSVLRALYASGVKPHIDNARNALSWLASTASSIASKVTGVLTKLRNTFKSIFSAISSTVRGAFSGVVSAIRGALNGLINVVNRATGALNRNVIGKLNRIPGVNFPSIPRIPNLARGGIIPATPGGRIVRVAEAGQAEAVIPLDRLDQMLVGGAGGGVAVNVTVNVAGHVATERDLARSIAVMVRDEIARVGRRNGGRTGL